MLSNDKKKQMILKVVMEKSAERFTTEDDDQESEISSPVKFNLDSNKLNYSQQKSDNIQQYKKVFRKC